MIDVHCHILNDIDDGSDCLQTSLMMAAMAADDGVEKVIATPHFTCHSDSDYSKLSVIKKKIDELQNAVNNARIPITIICGAECLIAEKISAAPPKIDGTDYALVEFYFDESIESIEKYLEDIKNLGIRAVIAHPERYTAVQKNKNILLHWSEQGYYLQLNKGSLFGQFGRKAEKIANWMLKKRIADLIGTDAHDTSSRTTRMLKTRNHIEKKYGEKYASLLMYENAQRLLNNEMLKKL